MTDLDTFRAALQQPDDGRPPALDEIIGAGRRLRRKRRIAATAAAVAVLVAAGAAGITLWPDRSQPGIPAAAWPGVVVDATGSWGQPVLTGLRVKDRDIVVTAFHNVNSAYPDIPFGVRSCAVEPSGRFFPCKGTFDDVPPDRSPGFHAINLPINIEYVDLPMFGYYVGPAATITARADGRLVTAQTAQWSEDESVVLFWFRFDDLHNDAKGFSPHVSDWTATDAAGRKLPLGKPFVIG